MESEPSASAHDSEPQLGAPMPEVLLPTEELPAISLGIRVKLVALMVTMSFLIVGALASYFPARQISELRAGLRDRATTYGRLASLQLRSAIAFNDQQTAREVLGTIAKDPLVMGAAVYTENGTRLDGDGTLSDLAQTARRGFGAPRTFYLPGRVLVTAPVQSLEGPRGTLVMELSTASAIVARDRLIRAALWVGGLALLLGTASAWLIARSLASRVERIARAAALVAKGDLEQRLDLDGPRDEIGILAHGFDAMVRRLRELIRHIHQAAQEENKRLELLVQQRTHELDRRNADLHLVLDNVEQGFVTIDRNARVIGERSRVVGSWLGSVSDGICLWDSLEAANPGSGAHFEMGWGQLLDGMMPAQVCLAQMPQELRIGGRYLRFEYKPIGSDEDFEKLLVVISDATALVERDRSEQEERDILDVSSRLLRDRRGFLEFFRETQSLIERVTQNNTDTVVLKRDLHTLKGNTAIFGLSLISALCHTAEAQLEASGTGVNCSPIVVQWQNTCAKIQHLLGERNDKAVEIEANEYEALVAAIRNGADRKLLERMVEAWRLDPLRARLERASEQLAATALRLGKGTVEVAIDSPRIYLGRDELTEFWSVFSHVLRNAAGHGLETAEERQARGKRGLASFVLRAGMDKQRLFIEVEDSGPGVDWEAVRARALQRGLPAANDADLTNALFTDGISTAAEATEISGRGVGLSAVRAACERRHGTIDVMTKKGEGTRFRFSWPPREFKSLVQIDGGVLQ